MLYGGSIPPGRFHGHDVTIQDVFEAVGAHAAGKMTDEELARARGRREPRRRRLRRPVHRQHDGDGLRGARHQPDGLVDGPRAVRRPRRGRLRGGQARDGRARSAACTPRRHHHQGVARERDRRGRPRAAARRTACCTCSRSPARPASSSRSTTSTASATRTPLLCDLKPGGQYVAVDLYEAGGVAGPRQAPARARRPARGRDRPSPARPSASSRRAPRRPTASSVVRPLDDPLKPTGGLAILRGNLAPEGCVVKLAGHERRHHTGPARVFEGEEAAMAAATHGGIQQGDVVVIRNEGPVGGPGMREMLGVTAAINGAGTRRARRAAHRRALLRRDPRLHGRPRRPRGGAAAARSRRCATATRSRSTSTTGAIDVDARRRRDRRAASPPTGRRTTAGLDRRAGEVRQARVERRRGRRHRCAEQPTARSDARCGLLLRREAPRAAR